MSTVHNAFKHNKDRQAVLAGGAIIMICITLLSCVSSFTIYKQGFTDLPDKAQVLLALAAVLTVEGAFVWLVYGFTRAFSSFMERVISFGGMCFLVLVMLTNIVTHFMMVKNLQLNVFQQGWLNWGAVTVFIAVLLITLGITLADPVIRLIRLELRYMGKQQEVILNAKTEGLDGEVVQRAMEERAAFEAEELAARILRPARISGATAQTPQRAIPQRPVGRRVGYTATDNVDNHIVDALTDEGPKA